MEIEVRKIALNKNVLNQLPTADYNVLKHCEVLGFLLNVRKGMTKAILVKYESNYYVVSTHWMKREESFQRKASSKRYYQWQFKDTETCDDAWEQYQGVLKLANERGQIYI